MMNEVYCALVNLMEAQRVRDKAHDEYDGESWNYYGQNYEDAVDEAHKRFDAGFLAAVKEAVEKLAVSPKTEG